MIQPPTELAPPEAIPVARPVSASSLPETPSPAVAVHVVPLDSTAHAMIPPQSGDLDLGDTNIELSRTEPAAVISAVAGGTALIPVLSQMVGIVFGVIALGRIRRARRRGVRMKGAGWAYFGLGSSAFALLCWGGVAASLFVVGQAIGDSVETLRDSIMPAKGMNHSIGNLILWGAACAKKGPPSV